MLTTVAAFREAWEAHMFCSRLEAEGVPAFVVHEYHIGNVWTYSTALGGVKVQVHDERSEEARSVERCCKDGEFRSLLESEFGALDDVHCPNCGSHEYWKRRPFVPAVITVTLLVLFGLIIPPTGWVYFCNQCNTKFRQPLYQSAPGKWAMIWMAIACELVLLSGLGLGLWTLGTQYSFDALAVAGLLAAPLVGRWLSRLGDDEK